ncbi:hypothetical protein SD51_13025 [Alicyclobacillus tengchongensis]|nr:hypothetical protein SD51_13025 [Alicyclobacillus tengchongensis]
MRKPRVWLFRPLPHGSNQMPYFLEKNRIALGYPIGKSLVNMTETAIKQDLRTNFGSDRGFKNLMRLRDAMNVGDLVIVPDDNLRDVYFCTVDSEYLYEPSLDVDEEGSGFPHQRSVKWFFDKQPLLRTELPQSLTESLRYPGTIADLSKHLATVANLLGLDLGLDEEPDESTSVIDWSDLVGLAYDAIERALRSNDYDASLRAAEIVLSQSNK